MHSVGRFLLGLALLLSLGRTNARAQTDAPDAEDEKLLKAAGVTVDGPGLVEFFRKRTPTADTEKRVAELLKRLGDKTFKVREQAAAELIALGPPALGGLRRAALTANLEAQRRARHCVDVIEKRNAPEAIAAAARLLRARPAAGACAALLKYLPGASDEIAEDLVEALFALSGKQGQVDASFAAALRGPASPRRAAAALVLGHRGTPEQKRQVRGLLEDADPTVRFRAAQGLLCGGDRSAVPALIELLDKAPVPLAEQAEDLLARAAGTQAPKATLGADGKERAPVWAAWSAWWADHKDKVDLAQADLRAPFADAPAQARKVTRRFLDALMRADNKTLGTTLEAPFVIDSILLFKTRAEVAAFFQKVVTAENAVTSYRITKVTRLVDYAGEPRRQAGIGKGEDKLKHLPQPHEIRAVYTAAWVGGRQEAAVLLVRVRGGRARVVGIGSVDAGKK